MPSPVAYIQGCFVPVDIWLELIRRYQGGGSGRKPLQPTKVFLTVVDGTVRKLEMFRNDIGVRFLHDFVVFDRKGGNDCE